MFASLSRFRRLTAVLSAFALMASVLAAAPLAAADDPKPDYPATFSACEGVAGSGPTFEDVPASHENAGDIDCIAYYGITQGTSATTYSPSMSVIREHMALFLTRLAGLVGIEMAADPPDAGFTDIGDLTAESQTAINQLADLGITKGTSANTYGPDGVVRRGHMALFIARLMDLMEPYEVNDEVYGHTPEDVVEVKAKAAAADDPDTDPDESAPAVAAKMVGSPYTDLGAATKEAYDAITALYELGVVSGINTTSYAPDASMTRASMAEFMAAMLDHSNARPAGISMQAKEPWAFGTIDTAIVISYRDDTFAPMTDVEINYFYTGNAQDGDTTNDGIQADTDKATLNDDGECSGTDGACNGQDDDVTDESGNFAIDGAVVEGQKNTYYAWMSDDDNKTFGPDATQASVTLASDNNATHFTVTSDISKNAVGENTVDMDVTGSVTFTIQLKDGDDDDAGDVAKPDVDIKIDFRRYVDADSDNIIDDPGDELTSISTTKLTTDGDGQATYTVNAPDSDSSKEEPSVLDQVSVSSTGLTGPQNDSNEDVPSLIVWRDENPGTANRVVLAVDKPDYAISYLSNTAQFVDAGAIATLYDMYGNVAGRTYEVDATIGGDTTNAANVLSNVRVKRNGQARLKRTKVPVTGGTTDNVLTVTVTGITAKDDVTLDPAIPVTDVNGSIYVVSKATGPADDVAVADLYADEDTFRGDDNNLYSYDSDDTYINSDGEIIDMATFEKEAKGQDVDVLVYDDDGSSVFRLRGPSDNN